LSAERTYPQIDAARNLIVGVAAYWLGALTGALLMMPWMALTVPADYSGDLAALWISVITHVPTVIGGFGAGLITGFGVKGGARRWLWAFVPASAYMVWFPVGGKWALRPSAEDILFYEALPRVSVAVACIGVAFITVATRRGTTPS
jgi:hypothetical protein